MMLDNVKERALDGPSLNGLWVLAVDDQRDAREIVKRLLTSAGAEVTVAESAEQALSVIRAACPDVLISDICMPERDGYELIREVREQGLNDRDLPAVAITAFAVQEDSRQALAAGFQAHLPKPLEAGALISTVAELAR